MTRRVAYCIVTSGFGGMEMGLLSILRHLDRHRYEPIVYLRCLNPDDGRRFRHELSLLHVPVRLLDLEGLPVEEARVAAGRPALFKSPIVKAALLAITPHSIKLARYWAVRVRRAARVFGQERFDVMHVLHGSYPSMELTLLAGRAAGIPMRISDVRSEPQWPHQPLAIRRWLTRRAIASVTHVKALSERMREQMHARCRIAYRKLSISSTLNDVELAPLYQLNGAAQAHKQRLGLGGCRGLTIIGRLSPEKGHAMLCDALSPLATRYPNARILVVGDGPLRAELERQVADRQLTGHVRFLGFRSDIAEILGMSDAVVVSSMIEGGPRVVLEAMAAAKPIVSTDVGFVPDVLIDGQMGRIVPQGDVTAMTQALDALLAAGDESLRAMGRAARQHVQDLERQWQVKDWVDSFYGEWNGACSRL